MTLTANSPEIVELLEAWHQNGRDHFEASYKNLDYDVTKRKWVDDHRKYLCLNCGTSGVMMAEKSTGRVYGIKGYGKVHTGRYLGTVTEITDKYLAATASQRIGFVTI